MSSSGAQTLQRQRATMRDVAALAGVGIKTVSRVVNDEANVSEDTRIRVERAIRALNFQPHLGAGSLRRGDRKTMTLGLLLDAVDNPFSAAINRAVERVASQHNVAVFAASAEDDPARERRLVDAFTRRRVDGLIITAVSPDQGYLQTEREQGTPIVFVDRLPVGIVADAVVTKNLSAAASATQHLIDHGHTAIAHLGDELSISTARERMAGYDQTMARSRITVPDRFRVAGLDSVELAYAQVVRMMRDPEPPTAFFTSQNLVTIGAVRALHDLGCQHEIALVGFDDLLLADLLSPAITVMAQDPATIGRVAAEAVFRRLAGDRGAEQTVEVPAALIVRGSGEIPPRSPDPA